MEKNSNTWKVFANRRYLNALQIGACIILVLIFFWSIKNEENEVASVWGVQYNGVNDHEPPFDTDEGMKSYDDIEQDVFIPLGYKIRDRTVIPALDYIQDFTCSQSFQSFLEAHRAQNGSQAPPKIIPWKLRRQYLLNGYVHLINTYSDDRREAGTETWTKTLLDGLMARKGEEIDNYANEGKAIYFAMEAHGVRGKKGMVVGSLSPWVEAIPLKLGASHITTVEYTKIQVEEGFSAISYIHPVELAEKYDEHIGKYDFIVSFSSLEHSGLGRYGDAPDPIGDLKEAQKVHCLLKPGGLFYVGFPIGWDILHWNLHRIYGRARLALFAAGYDIVDVFYLDQKVTVDKMMEWFQRPKDIETNMNINWGQNSLWRQPLIVLRKR